MNTPLAIFCARVAAALPPVGRLQVPCNQYYRFLDPPGEGREVDKGTGNQELLRDYNEMLAGPACLAFKAVTQGRRIRNVCTHFPGQAGAWASG